MEISIEIVRAGLRRQFGAAWGSVLHRELVLVVLRDGEGNVGYGEAAPLEAYDGVTVADVVRELRACRPALEGTSGFDAARVRAYCAQLTILPQALAAIDLALWDLAGRRAGQPVWRLLGADAARPVALNYTIAASHRAGAAREAAIARAGGYACIKMKVAVGDDAARLAAVRATVGPETAIRLDANGGWSPEEARAALRVLAAAGLELCEEPVSGVDAIGALAASTDVALAIDETAADPAALERRVCRAVCLKVARCGGISGLLEAAARARRAGYELYVASTLDGPLGIAAALHAAAAIGPDRPCGLATLALFKRSVPALTVNRGQLRPPDGPGLGTGLVGWYR